MTMSQGGYEEVARSGIMKIVYKAAINFITAPNYSILNGGNGYIYQ